MEKDVQKLLKVQNAVKQMVANGESPDYIDNFLTQQGETADSIRAMNQFGAEKVANARKSVQELKDYQQSTPQKLKKAAQVAGAGLMGGLAGVVGGVERLLNARTLGGYGWLNKKLGGAYEERQKEQQDLAESVGLGGVNKAANLAIDIGGAIRSPIFKVLPNPMTAKTTLGSALRGAATGGVASGLQSAFKNDSLENVAKDAKWGALFGGVAPVVIRGGKELLSQFAGATTQKGDQAIKNAYSAGQRGSRAFAEGKKMTAEEIVKTAQEGRSEIQRAASRAISEGKNAIGNRPVDKQGLYNSLRDWAQNRYLYNGTNLASKGEQRVLGEAEKIINKLTKKKDIDVKTLDVLKQQIYKIVPENVNDRAAKAARDSIYGIVSDYLNKASPEYASVMRPYAQAMEELGRIAESGGVKETGTKVATAINKLVKASKNPETAGIIQKIGGQDLVDRLAGYDLRSALPETQIGRMIAAGLAGAGLGTGGSSLTWLPLMSPRIMGNVAYGAGRLSSFMPTVPNTVNALNYLRLK